MEALNTVRRQIEAGDREGARRELSRILQADPRHVSAWALLATLLETTEQRADCYRRILVIDPDNQEAAAKLWEITHTSTATPPETTEGNPLRCQQCGGTMEVHFEGYWRDKQAICPYCGTRSDLPDALKRVIHEREQEEHGGESRTIERTIIETRSEHGIDQESHTIVSESRVQSHQSKSETPTTLERFVTFLTGQDSEAKPKEKRLTPEDIVAMAGGPMPVEERRICPQCQATVSKEATRCQWCGVRLA